MKEYLIREKLETRVLVPDTFAVTVGKVVVPQTFCKIMKNLNIL